MSYNSEVFTYNERYSRSLKPSGLCILCYREGCMGSQIILKSLPIKNKAEQGLPWWSSG